MRTILQAENLTKDYRVGKVNVHALRGVSLEVHEGEFLAIMGPSGCGKTTMLHLFGGLLTPYRFKEDGYSTSKDRFRVSTI